jgi:hypothetical protein
MSRYNLDKVLEPWDLSFTIGGKDIPIAPPKVGDLIPLSKLKEDDPEALPKIVLFLAGAFALPQPVVNRWPPQQTMAILKVILEHFNTHIAKNFPATLAPEPAAVANPETPQAGS